MTRAGAFWRRLCVILPNVLENEKPLRPTPENTSIKKGGEMIMNLKKKVAAMLLVLALTPAYVMAAEGEKEFNGTVVSKEEKSIKVKTKEGEKTLAVGTKTKGLENAKEGEKVTIKYTEKDGQLRASEINPR